MKYILLTLFVLAFTFFARAEDVISLTTARAAGETLTFMTLQNNRKDYVEVSVDGGTTRTTIYGSPRFGDVRLYYSVTVPAGGSILIYNSDDHFFCNYEQLTQLDISGHHTLRMLDVHNNKLSMDISTLLAGTNLTVGVEVSFNSITGTTSFINNLPAGLIRIGFGGNQISGTIPDLSRFTNLDMFIAFLNNLTGTIPPITGLNKMTRFDVSFNFLDNITNFVWPAGLTDYNIRYNRFNFSVFEGITDATTFNNVRSSLIAPQNIIPKPYFSNNVIQTDGTEGGILSKLTYQWFKSGATTPFLEKTGNNTLTQEELNTAGIAVDDVMYAKIFHADITTSTNSLVFTTDTISRYFALPVRFGLLNANVRNGLLNLKFSTESETNCSHYEIEVSKDGTNWKTIGNLKSKAMNGNSTAALHYDFSTNLAGSGLMTLGILSLLGWGYARRRKELVVIGIAFLMVGFVACSKSNEAYNTGKKEKVFVRVKQVDIDGKFSYSKIIQAVEE